MTSNTFSFFCLPRPPRVADPQIMAIEIHDSGGNLPYIMELWHGNMVCSDRASVPYGKGSLSYRNRQAKVLGKQAVCQETLVYLHPNRISATSDERPTCKDDDVLT